MFWQIANRLKPIKIKMHGPAHAPHSYLAAALSRGDFSTDAALNAGIEDVQKIPTGLTQYEEEAIKAAMPELRESIQKGVDFVNQNS